MDGFTCSRRLPNDCTVLWRAALAELICTSLLITVGCGSRNDKDFESVVQENIQVPFTFGFAVATLTKCIGHISGGHINPAVTLAMLVSRRITAIRALLYVMAQLGGSLIGNGILKAVTADWTTDSHCHVAFGEDVSPFPGGVVVEGLITFALVFTLLSSTGDGLDTLCLGMCVVFCHLFAVGPSFVYFF